MKLPFVADKAFDKCDFTKTGLQKAEYECCSFSNCNMSGVDLTGVVFTDCTFLLCDMSLDILNGTSMRNVHFKDSKMLGLRFDQCNDLGLEVSFEGCILNHSSFYKVKLKKTRFKYCQLQETDFSASDLSGAIMDACDFLRATFDATILEKADLKTSYNYIIDPTNNKIKKAKFALPAAIGLLATFDIEIDTSTQ